MELDLTVQAYNRVVVAVDGARSHAFDPTLLAPGSGEPPLPQPLDDPIVYGQAVYAALFPAHSPAAAALAAERKGILLVAEDVLQPVPWEYAHDGDDFLVLDLPFTRGLPADRRRPPPQLSEALHVVAVPSAPLDESVPPLLIEEEWLRLVEEVEQAARETGNAIAELCTALLGVLFAVLALGGTFPPPLLAALPRARARVGRVGSALPGSARRYLGYPPAQLPALSPQPQPNAARTGAHGRLQSALGGGGRRALCTGLSGAGRPGGDGDLGSVG